MEKYNTITVLNLPNCRINAFGVMQIAEMLTNIGCLRDLNLDMNPNAQENFHLLCQPAGKLQYLTLRHCEISDDGAKKIAKELQYRDPPNGPKLISLSLSNNRITCDGAAYLGSMLRINRSLRNLSLVANRIHDDGAWLIIRELKITTLTHEEVVDLRRRKFEEIAIAEELLSKQSNDPVEEELKKNNKSRLVRSLSKRSRKSSIDMSMKGLRTGSIIRDLESAQKKNAAEDCEKNHPFKTESFPMNGVLVSTGNLCLQYLDLSCNYFLSETEFHKTLTDIPT
ncbi:ribonuclease inhibitor-like isoform X2 [Lasioglossum baleicum]|uniref:ribonuclease inhibitor-like isoform X2 n=1 Tax=Lasioglossum baleicum TaxID=434251 RepID=UPI003FCD7291